MNILTFQILKSQFLDLLYNFRTYFIIAVPIIIYYPIDHYFFNDYEILTFQFLSSFFINIFISGIVIINTHRYVILKENNFYNLNLKFKIMINYFLFGIFLLFIALAPLYITFLLFEKFKILIETEYFTTLVGLISWIILIILILILSLISFLFVYPFFAFALPKIAIGERFKINKIWRETKGFRLTIILQVIIIYSPLFTLEIFYDDLINDQIVNLLFIPLEIFAISSLSKTYLLRYKKN